MRVALYVRVSTQHQTHTQTIDQQLDRLRAYVQTQGWLLADDLIFRDDGFSGASLHRPGLERLREQVAAGALDRLLLTAPRSAGPQLCPSGALAGRIRPGGLYRGVLGSPDEPRSP
jgi:hypothetical protein